MEEIDISDESFQINPNIKMIMNERMKIYQEKEKESLKEKLTWMIL